jgi:lipopolysaccharide transport system permease protein
MERPLSTSRDQSRDLGLCKVWTAAEVSPSSQVSSVARREHKNPRLSAQNATVRTLTTIRPPSFSIKTIVSGLTTMVDHRELLYTLTLLRLTVRYKQSILGWMWAVLQPLAMMIVYTLVFSRLVGVKSEGVPYPLFVFSALLPWILFSGAVSNAINGLVVHANLLSKLHFPREIIPLSYVFAALVDFAIACLLLGLVMVYYHIAISWRVLYILPIIVILVAFTSAVALFLSSIHARFRDIAAALPLVLQIGVFATPVTYSSASIPARLQRFYMLNPVASLIENFRRVVIHGSSPDISMVITSTVITVFCLAAAYGYFKANETTIADVI